MNIKNKIKENKINITIWAVYAIITLIIAVVFHEKWRDEAQAWMIARDLNFIDMLKQMSYEGHPPLWYIILMPFAKLGFPYITETIISWAIMSITAWLVLTKSPFKKSIQVLLLLTAPFIYWYPVISRSYCLIPLAISLIAIYHKDRKQKNIQYTLSILLLAYTHVLMLGLVGILYLFFFIEEIFYTKKSKEQIRNLSISLIIAVVGLVTLVLLLWSSTTTNTQLPINFDLNMDRILSVLKKVQTNIFGSIGDTSGFIVFSNILCIILIMSQWQKSKKNTIIALVGIGWELCIYLFIYGISEEKANTILFICLLIAWIGLEQQGMEKENKTEILPKMFKEIEFGCLMLITLSIIQGITLICDDVSYRYSYSKETAEYIKQNLEEDAIFVCTNAPYASAIIPYTEKVKFWNPSSEQYFTFVTWDEISNTELPIDEIIKRVKENFTSEQNIYLLNCHNMQITAEVEGLQEKHILSNLMYESEDKGIAEEFYGIYRINWDI